MKNMENNRIKFLPAISIITVVKNDEKNILKTLESVLMQDYPSLQYIVWDGRSEDGTLKILNEYRDAFIKKGIDYIVLSCEDSGIYDAMNKSVQYATGEWIYYLNSKDRLYDCSVLKEVFGKEKYEEDCVYGNTWNVVKERLYHKQAYPIETIYYRAPFIHQALFVRRKVFKKYMFDTHYSLAADYDLFVRMYVDGISYKRIDVDIAFFDMEGVSQNNEAIRRKEWMDIQRKSGLSDKKRIHRFILENIVIKAKSHSCIKNIYYFFKEKNGECAKISKQGKRKKCNN